MKHISFGEEERISSLRQLQILDTPAQESFDRITELCCAVFNCDFSMISLLDSDRQWFLSRHGFDISETPRDISICAHAIRSERHLLISDMLDDERFSANPLVVEPGVRSYLGQPIVSPDNRIIGTLCVADGRHNHFDEQQLRMLRPLAKTVEGLIEAYALQLKASKLAANLRERTKRLEDANRIFRQAERTANIGSWEINLATGRVAYSDEALRIMAYDKAKRLSLTDAIALYVDRDRKRVQSALDEVVELQSTRSLEADIIDFAGNRKTLHVAGEFIASDRERPPRIIGVMQDITESRHAKLALQRAADHDSLTGLYNRKAFDRLLAERIIVRRREGGDFSILLLDLDGFKDINDTYGHLVGDAVLEELSTRISTALPTGTIAARWGGDEFAIITPPGFPVSEATTLAETLIANLTQQLTIADRKAAVSATCGVAQCDDSVSGRELIRRADLALYHGKARGRGRAHVYLTSLETGNRTRQEAIGKVRAALRDERIYAGYQPIVHLPTRGIIGFEALMRLTTMAGEQITATQVLPALIDPLLSEEVGQRMISLVCSDFPKIEKSQPTATFVSINATEADLLSKDFGHRLLDSLSRNSIDPKKVTLEITETMLLVNDPAEIQRVLQELSRSGMQIALDDFGTGFSSLAHLRDFPIDKLKIDGSFVQQMTVDNQSKSIVQALIGMGRSMGLEVIAEGVETEEQFQLLQKMGCYYGQGYFFGAAETACRLKPIEF